MSTTPLGVQVVFSYDLATLTDLAIITATFEHPIHGRYNTAVYRKDGTIKLSAVMG